MTLTWELLSETFDKLNTRYFDGELERPFRFEITDSKSYLGQFHWSGPHSDYRNIDSIRISKVWNMNLKEFENVMCHEMIHKWQWQNGYKIGHVKEFKIKGRQITAMSNGYITVGRCTNLSQETRESETSKTTTKREVIITYKKDGKPFVAVLASNRVDEILRWLPKSTGVSDVNCYIACHEMYGRMKRSVKTVHGYPVEAKGIISKR